MNESVESDALVIPSSHRPARCRTPAVHDHPLVLLHEPEPVHLLQGLGVAHISIFTYRIICRTMTSMCLSLMLTPCSR